MKSKSFKNTDNATSRFISLVLRHQPEIIHIRLDRHGWADVDELINGVRTSRRSLTREDLERIVREDAKQRYSFSADGTKIRANQGHSIPVDLELLPRIPPNPLYHGTAARFWDSIQEKGLLKMSRQYVHLSSNVKTAIDVGSRHGAPLVLRIDTERMVRDGHLFYLSENGVWLCEHVPADCLQREEI